MIKNHFFSILHTAREHGGWSPGTEKWDAHAELVAILKRGVIGVSRVQFGGLKRQADRKEYIKQIKCFY